MFTKPILKLIQPEGFKVSLSCLPPSSLTNISRQFGNNVVKYSPKCTVLHNLHTDTMILVCFNMNEQQTNKRSTMIERLELHCHYIIWRLLYPYVDVWNWTLFKYFLLNVSNNAAFSYKYLVFFVRKAILVGFSACLYTYM